MDIRHQISSGRSFFRLRFFLIGIVTVMIFLTLSGISIGVNSEPEIVEIDCGPPPISIKLYERISYISLAAGFGMIFILTLLNNKFLKTVTSLLALISFGTCGYIYFTADYEEIRRIIFNY